MFGGGAVLDARRGLPFCCATFSAPTIGALLKAGGDLQ